MMQRRSFVKTLACAGLAGLVRPRILLGDPLPTDPLWVHVQATGGWDVALFCDPKPSLRMKGLQRDIYVYGAPIGLVNGMPVHGQATLKPATTTVVRETPGGGIRYLGLADFHADPNNPNLPYRSFFPTYHDRITIFNGIDTGTLNHQIGVRYCASGSTNEGFPCLAGQIAWARGADRPLALMNLGGYAETGGVLSAQPLAGTALPNLLRLVAPNDLSGNNGGGDHLLDPASLALVEKAHAARLQRLRATLNLPGHRRAIDQQIAAESGLGALSSLQFSGADQSLSNVVSVGIDAFRNGLATAMNLQVGGFDSHGDNEQDQTLALFGLLETVKLILQSTESPGNGKGAVPAIVVVTSDFGRSPYHRNGGTDHWPVTSMMVVQNAVVRAAGFPLPTNRTIGASTDGGELQALRAVKLDPVRLQPDPQGVTLTPGHLVRALRRLARIDGSPKLSRWPLQVDRDLAIG